MAEVNNIIRKNKPINIKNKKAVKQSLAKASIKGKNTTKKVVKKASTVKSTVKSKDVEELNNLTVTSVVEKKENKKATKPTSHKAVYKEKTAAKRKNNTKKEPNNILRKISKEEKEQEKIEEKLTKEEPKEIVLTKTKKEIKKEEKRIKKLEKKKLKKEKKVKEKEEKKKLKEKQQKEKDELKKKNKQKNKSKIELPKEWKTINSKNNKVVKEEPKSFKGKIKSSIFESIDEQELKERKKKSKDSLKKTIIVFLIIFIVVAVIIYALVKYNDYVKKQLAIYDAYRIGDVVYLKDNSTWLVIEDSDSKNDSIKLLSSDFTDLNQDGQMNEHDIVQYNKTKSTEYSTSDENSIGYFLNKTVKDLYEDKVGDIIEISILTSKEYVKVRERLNYGDEWSSQNWLAGSSYRNYWILSEKNNKVYVVTEKGTFYLSEPTIYKFIRPTIVIKKDNVTKVEEKRSITVDLINGLKRK